MAHVAQLRRTVTRGANKTVEVVYLITSAAHHTAPHAVLAAWVQGHWCIWGYLPLAGANRLDHVPRRHLRRRPSQVRTGRTPHVMASLRNTVLGILRLAGWTNIAAALRHHARAPERAITCALTC